MAWIDNEKPVAPDIINFQLLNKDFANDEIIISCVNKNFTKGVGIKQYAIYISPEIKTLKDVPIYKLITSQSEINFPIKSISADWKYVYVAISAVSKRNNESSISKIFTFQRSGEHWILSEP